MGNDELPLGGGEDYTAPQVPASEWPKEVVAGATGPQEEGQEEEERQVTRLAAGFYLAHGTTHALHRGADGAPFRGERRFEVQRELRRLNQHEWTILEVTAGDFPWGE